MASGILETPVPPIQGFTPAEGVSVPSTATGYTPTPYTVKPESLVQEQVKKIVGEDSPLMQQARTKAAQTMNARGLLNSTLNTQAGQEAVISQSLPIATADAATYDRAMTNTAAAKNTASQFGAAAENTSSQTNAQLATQMNTTNANAKNQALSQEAQAANTRSLAVIDNNTKMKLTEMDAQYREILQTSVNAANMYQEMVKNIAAISVDQTLTKAAKDSAVQTQLNLFNQGLQMSGDIAKTLPAEIQALDLSSFFQSATGPGGGAPGAAPIAGTDPLKAVWSDGEKHTPPAAGDALEVPGYGWWSHNGKFYATQVEAINQKANPVPPPTPTPTPTPAPSGGGWLPTIPYVPTGGGTIASASTAPKVGSIYTASAAPPANLQYKSADRTGPARAGYALNPRTHKWTWVVP